MQRNCLLEINLRLTTTSGFHTYLTHQLAPVVEEIIVKSSRDLALKDLQGHILHLLIHLSVLTKVSRETREAEATVWVQADIKPSDPLRGQDEAKKK